MIERAYLEKPARGPIRIEERLVQDEMIRTGIPFSFITVKLIQRRSLELDGTCLVVGDMVMTHGALSQLRIPIPPPIDYPECLRRYLGRQIWQSTLGELERKIAGGPSRPTFAKPADRRKSFTGTVFAFSDDFYAIGNVSRRQTIWLSEVVSWISEYRVYVAYNKIVEIAHYAGDLKVRLDEGVVNDAIQVFHASGEAPDGYAIDFGVLGNGETALVEVNEGYSLGAYAISSADYSKVIVARWKQLLESGPFASGL